VRTQSPLALVWNKVDSVFQLSHSPAGSSKQANCHHDQGAGREVGIDAAAQVHVCKGCTHSWPAHVLELGCSVAEPASAAA
jgi:hypothetical protein